VVVQQLRTPAAPPATALAPVWICLPTYNEAENVASCVAAVLDVADEHSLDAHILVIDDASPDGTGAIADELAAREPRVAVLHRDRKEGLGSAYRAGFRRALDAGAEVVVEMDCDLSHDPRALPQMLAALRESDLVLGSRYVGGGGTQNWGLLRRLVSRGGCLYARVVLGVAIADLTGGFKCFRRQVLQALPLDDVRSAGYGFQVELTYLALQQGFRVAEVPIVFRERERGASKMTLPIVWEAAAVVPALRLRNARRRAGIVAGGRS
jgi:dolichol-phosphate mannosyltransferase